MFLVMIKGYWRRVRRVVSFYTVPYIGYGFLPACMMGGLMASFGIGNDNTG